MSDERRRFMSNLFEIGKRAAGGDSKALDYLVAAAGDPKDDLWDFCT